MDSGSRSQRGKPVAVGRPLSCIALYCLNPCVYRERLPPAWCFQLPPGATTGWSGGWTKVAATVNMCPPNQTSFPGLQCESLHTTIDYHTARDKE